MHPVLVATAVKTGRPVLKTTLAVILLGALILIVLVRGAATGQTLGALADNAQQPATECGAVPADSAQVTNMAHVAAAGRSMGLPDEALIIAGAVILVEAGAKNLASLAVPESLTYPNDGAAPGDHDSVGLFQQRTSWGSVQDRMTPTTSARLFFNRLIGIPWQTMTPGEAAQTIQVSAHPDRYAARVDEARTLVDRAVGSVTCPDLTAAQQAAVTVIGGAAWTRIVMQGKFLDSDTHARIVAALGSAWRLNQGSWSTSVAASGGTHAGAGVADLTPTGLGWVEAETALRGKGLIAWFRNWPGNLHIHLVNPHVDGLSPSASNQVSAWNRGEDGLGSTPGR